MFDVDNGSKWTCEMMIDELFITDMLTVKDGEVTHDGWLMVDGL